MPDTTIISIDAMGGDHGPPVVIAAIARDAPEWSSKGVRFLLHGDQARLEAELAKSPAARALCEIRHTDRVISSDEKPARRCGAARAPASGTPSIRFGRANHTPLSRPATPAP